MRAWLGWVAVTLLVALAFTSGPDALDTSPPASHVQVATSELGDERDPQVRDGALESLHQIVDLRAPGHSRLAALPPSSQTIAPIPVRGALQVTPQRTPATVSAVSGRSRLGACTPEALQIFRC